MTISSKVWASRILRGRRSLLEGESLEPGRGDTGKHQLASMGIYRHNPAQIVVAGFVHAGLSCVRSHDLSPWHRAGRTASSLEGGEDDRGTLRVGLRDWTFIRHAGLHVEDFGAANWGSASRWNGSSDNLLHYCCRVSHSIRGTWSSPAV